MYAEWKNTLELWRQCTKLFSYHSHNTIKRKLAFEVSENKNERNVYEALTFLWAKDNAMVITCFMPVCYHTNSTFERKMSLLRSSNSNVFSFVMRYFYCVCINWRHNTEVVFLCLYVLYLKPLIIFRVNLVLGFTFIFIGRIWCYSHRSSVAFALYEVRIKLTFFLQYGTSIKKYRSNKISIILLRTSFDTEENCFFALYSVVSVVWWIFHQYTCSICDKWAPNSVGYGKLQSTHFVFH
jgi:hypothetical protein